MDNLSTEISSQIGALELSDYLESQDDGVLEAAGAAIGPMETKSAQCPTYNIFAGCRFHPDA
jgi:hypothetical protein